VNGVTLRVGAAPVKQRHRVDLPSVATQHFQGEIEPVERKR